MGLGRIFLNLSVLWPSDPQNYIISLPTCQEKNKYFLEKYLSPNIRGKPVY